MDASCGPSSALSQLSKHAQRDTSLQHGLINRAGEGQQNRQGGFRNQPGFDASLNQEFQNFSGRSGTPVFTDRFSGAGPVSQPQFRQQGGQHQQNRWIQDFNGLSIENRPAAQHAQQSQHGKADWHKQFMNLMNQQGAQQQPQFQPSMTNSNYRLGSMGQYGPQYGLQNSTMTQPQNQQAQVEADLLENSEALESQFDQLERELAMEEQAISEDALISEIDKEQFVKAAREVQQSMRDGKNIKSEELASKFEQLNFLKLMNSISDRKVELSKEGDKLVETETGEDIRKHLSDPLQYEKDPTYHQKPFEVHESSRIPPMAYSSSPQITKESENVRSHLPDPLAHIKDGMLPDNLSALQAAKIISGGQVSNSAWMEDELWLADPSRLLGGQLAFGDRPASSGNSSNNSIMEPEWQEVYDDYRHDDDYH